MEDLKLISVEDEGSRHVSCLIVGDYITSPKTALFEAHEYESDGTLSQASSDIDREGAEKLIKWLQDFFELGETK